MADLLVKPGALTDAQARNLVIKALRQARKTYRTADTQGEKLERELDRLIKRKTRISPSSLSSLATLYSNYIDTVTAVQRSLTTAYETVSLF